MCARSWTTCCRQSATVADGRLLTALAITALATAAAVRGSRGIVRRTDRSVQQVSIDHIFYRLTKLEADAVRVGHTDARDPIWVLWFNRFPSEEAQDEIGGVVEGAFPHVTGEFVGDRWFLWPGDTIPARKQQTLFQEEIETIAAEVRRLLTASQRQGSRGLVRGGSAPISINDIFRRATKAEADAFRASVQSRPPGTGRSRKTREPIYIFDYEQLTHDSSPEAVDELGGVVEGTDLEHEWTAKGWIVLWPAKNQSKKSWEADVETIASELAELLKKAGSRGVVRRGRSGDRDWADVRSFSRKELFDHSDVGQFTSEMVRDAAYGHTGALMFVTMDGGHLCRRCVQQEIEQVVDATDAPGTNRQWEIVGVQIPEDTNVCDHCDRTIG